jgi:hypothetical protein
MSKAPRLLAATATLIALIAVNASNASAADVNLKYEVLDNEVPVGGEKILPATVVKTNFTLEAGTLKLTCSKLKVAGGKIEPNGAGKALSLEFGSCVVTSNESTCEIPKGEIDTKAVKTQAEGEPVPLEDKFNDAEVKFEPETGAEIGRLTIASKPGKVCARAGTYIIEGTTTCDVVSLVEADKEQAKHTLACVAVTGGVEESTLKLGGAAAKLSGEAEIELESKKNWSLAEGS